MNGEAEPRMVCACCEKQPAEATARKDLFWTLCHDCLGAITRHLWIREPGTSEFEIPAYHRKALGILEWAKERAVWPGR